MVFLNGTRNDLNRLLPAYRGLQPVEKARMTEFSLIWQLFERRVTTNENVVATIRYGHWYCWRERAILCKSEDSFRYFKARYSGTDEAERRFGHLLGVRGENLRQCIEAGLQNDANDHRKVRSCAAICYRLRNNSSHGAKAAYGFEDQRLNFTQAVKFMNSCLEELAQ